MQTMLFILHVRERYNIKVQQNFSFREMNWIVPDESEISLHGWPAEECMCCQPVMIERSLSKQYANTMCQTSVHNNWREKHDKENKCGQFLQLNDSQSSWHSLSIEMKLLIQINLLYCFVKDTNNIIERSEFVQKFKALTAVAFLQNDPLAMLWWCAWHLRKGQCFDCSSYLMFSSILI